MGIILQESNFTNYQFAVKTVSQPALLQAMITRYEQEAIERLLGLTVSEQYPISLAASFIADCAANFPNPPVEPINLKIYNYLSFQIGGRIWQSRGMVDILTSVVFYWFVMNKMVGDSQSGIQAPNIDAAFKVMLKDGGRYAASRYNDAIESIQAIRRFLKFGNGQGGAGNGGSIDYPNYIEPRHEFEYKYFL
jgi:hypothetical protein